jgi:hypothetical protein
MVRDFEPNVCKHKGIITFFIHAPPPHFPNKQVAEYPAGVEEKNGKPL